MLTLQQKKKRISGMHDEVHELHPFLQAFFRKLPMVNDVRYTHGTQEFGADFVLTKTDPSTERVRYVGVVVKAGQINQSSITELDRQIDECRSIPRTAEHGLKSVHIGEVWVVGNDTISNNAKEKIRAKYRGVTIEFFDADDLVERIDKHAKFLWENVPTGISQYLVGLDERLSAEESTSHLLGNIDNIPEIELELSPVELDKFKKRRQRKKVDLVRLQDEIDSRTVVIIEGDMGAGKSHLLRALGRQFTSLDMFETRRYVPVHISYPRLVKEFGGSTQNCIDSSLGEAVKDLSEIDHKIILLIDGLDEVTPDPEESIDAIAKLISQVREHENQKLILTTRPNASDRTNYATAPDVRHIEIRPLTLGKIVQFVRDICTAANLPSRFIDDVNNSELFRQLPQNPIAAQLLTRLLLERRDELPQSLTELYKKSMELMLGRWDESKGLADQQEYDVSRRVFGRVADFVLRNRLSVIAAADVSRTLQEYLSERNLVVDRARIESRMFERSGILHKDDKAGTVIFRHRSFAEYLFAEHHLGENDLGTDIHPFKGYWANVYFFWIGLKGDCEEILQKILSTPCADSDEQLVRLFLTPQYLMAGNLTPYSLTRKSVSRLFLEAAELYHSGLKGNGPEFVSRLSPMQFLWLLTFVIRRRYGYKFFKPALDDAAIEICESLAPRFIKATALFFAASTANDLGADEPFELLLEQFKLSEIPITVSLAIGAESQELDQGRMSRSLKAFGKKLRQMITVDKGGRHSVDALFENAIGSSASKEIDRSGRNG